MLLGPIRPDHTICASRVQSRSALRSWCHILRMASEHIRLASDALKTPDSISGIVCMCTSTMSLCHSTSSFDARNHNWHLCTLLLLDSSPKFAYFCRNLGISRVRMNRKTLPSFIVFPFCGCEAFSVGGTKNIFGSDTQLIPFDRRNMLNTTFVTWTTGKRPEKKLIYAAHIVL